MHDRLTKVQRWQCSHNAAGGQSCDAIKGNECMCLCSMQPRQGLIVVSSRGITYSATLLVHLRQGRRRFPLGSLSQFADQHVPWTL